MPSGVNQAQASAPPAGIWTGTKSISAKFGIGLIGLPSWTISLASTNVCRELLLRGAQNRRRIAAHVDERHAGRLQLGRATDSVSVPRAGRRKRLGGAHALARV